MTRADSTLLRRDVLALGMAAAAAAGPSGAQEAYAWQSVGQPLKEPIVFVDDRGHRRELAEFRGRPVLLNLWATWCAPCVLELPALDRVQRDFGARRLMVLPLSLDRQGMPAVRQAYRRLKLRHLPSFVDVTGVSATRLGIKGLPATWAIAATGEVVARRRGAAEWDDEAERRQLRELLNLAAPS